MNAPSSFSRAANNTVTTLDNLINQVFTDANGAITGNQGLGVNSAALVQVTTGAIAGTYLIINDGTAGFQSSNDLAFLIQIYTRIRNIESGSTYRIFTYNLLLPFWALVLHLRHIGNTVLHSVLCHQSWLFLILAMA